MFLQSIILRDLLLRNIKSFYQFVLSKCRIFQEFYSSQSAITDSTVLCTRFCYGILFHEKLFYFKDIEYEKHALSKIYEF